MPTGRMKPLAVAGPGVPCACTPLPATVDIFPVALSTMRTRKFPESLEVLRILLAEDPTDSSVVAAMADVMTKSGACDQADAPEPADRR